MINICQQSCFFYRMEVFMFYWADDAIYSGGFFFTFDVKV